MAKLKNIKRVNMKEKEDITKLEKVLLLIIGIVIGYIFMILT